MMHFLKTVFFIQCGSTKKLLNVQLYSSPVSISEVTVVSPIKGYQLLFETCRDQTVVFPKT